MRGQTKHTGRKSQRRWRGWAKQTPGDMNRKSATNFSTKRVFKYSLMSEFLLVGDSEERVGKDDDSDETGYSW